MPSHEIDDLSLTIGEIKTSVKALERRAEEDRRLSEKRHDDNQSAIRQVERQNDATSRAIGDLSKTLEALIKKFDAHVLSVQPQLAAALGSRARLTALASIGLIALLAIGKLIETGATWLVQHFISIKFGG
jgi:hypothetical protein